MSDKERASPRCTKVYKGHVNTKYCLQSAFSTTGDKYVVSGSEDNAVCLWDLNSRELVQRLDGTPPLLRVLLLSDVH